MSTTPSESDPNKTPHVEQSHIEIVADENWKERVKAEDARLDAELKQQSKASQAEEKPAGRVETKTENLPDQIPPLGFDAVVRLFMTQAMVAMGLVPDPQGNRSKHMPLARYFIETLSMLEEKTKGNLTQDEARLLGATLHELRMKYVEVSRQS